MIILIVHRSNNKKTVYRSTRKKKKIKGCINFYSLIHFFVTYSLIHLDQWMYLF